MASAHLRPPTEPSLQELERALGGRPAAEKRLAPLLGETIERQPGRALEWLKAHGGPWMDSAGAVRPLVSILARRLLAMDEVDQASEVLGLSDGWGISVGCEVWLEVGRAHAHRGDHGKAREILDAVAARADRPPDVWRDLGALAKSEGRYADAHGCLTQLVAADASLATAAYAYRERSELGTDGGRPVRIAVLSSFVIDQLVYYLDFECRRAGLVPSIYVAPYGQYVKEALDPDSALYRFRPEIVFVALAVEDLCPVVEGMPSGDELESASEQARELVTSLVEGLEAHSDALVVLHEFAPAGRTPPLGILDHRAAPGVGRWLQDLNRTVAAKCLTGQRVYILPWQDVLGWCGRKHSRNAKLTHMARIRLTETALRELAAYYMRYLKPLKALTRKCIVVDLDGTLWGGVVGEVGPEGVELGPTAPGSEYVEFQRGLLALTRRGILLAVCSKNNPEDALAVIRHHKHMVLREKHFAAMRINWRNKADNLREIADELNIGLDAIAFFDDNRTETELVRQMLPEVLTVNLPRDASQYRALLDDMADFETLAITREDEARTEAYSRTAERRALRERSRSMEDYLRSLQIEIEVCEADKSSLSRLVQMFSKTNQFNLTTKRYQVADLDRFMQSTTFVVYVLKARDRFGDHGTVGAAVVEVAVPSWRIDSLLMSCRVMGLSIETAFLSRIVDDATKAGAKTLVGEFIPTKKNLPVERLYASHGFTPAEAAGDCQRWELDLANASIRVPEWIRLGLHSGEGQHEG